MSRKSKVLTLDSYSTRGKRENKLARADNIYSNSYIGFILTLLFVAIDSFCCYSCWNAAQTQSITMNILMTVGCALTLDVPPMLCAYALVKYKQGMLSKSKTKVITIGTIAVVSLVICGYFAFRIVTKDLIFDSVASGGITNAAVQGSDSAGQNSNSNLFPAIYSGIIPLATSITSFIATYLTASPLKDRIHKLRKAKITTEANMADLNMAIAEAEDVTSYSDYLIAREDDLYAHFLDELEAQKIVLKQIARIVIMQKLSNPDAISELTESGHTLNNNSGISHIPQTASRAIITQHN